MLARHGPPCGHRVSTSARHPRDRECSSEVEHRTRSGCRRFDPCHSTRCSSSGRASDFNLTVEGSIPSITEIGLSRQWVERPDTFRSCLTSGFRGRPAGSVEIRAAACAKARNGTGTALRRRPAHRMTVKAGRDQVARTLRAAPSRLPDARSPAPAASQGQPAPRLISRHHPMASRNFWIGSFRRPRPHPEGLTAGMIWTQDRVDPPATGTI